MSTTLTYASARHDSAAWRLPGLPLAIRQRFASLFAGRQAPAPLSRTEQAQREAEHVRQIADKLFKTDPACASDLYAAANRHEVENGCDR